MWFWWFVCGQLDVLVDLSRSSATTQVGVFQHDGSVTETTTVETCLMNATAVSMLAATTLVTGRPSSTNTYKPLRPHFPLKIPTAFDVLSRIRSTN